MRVCGAVQKEPTPTGDGVQICSGETKRTHASWKTSFFCFNTRYTMPPCAYMHTYIPTLHPRRHSHFLASLRAACNNKNVRHEVGGGSSAGFLGFGRCGRVRQPICVCEGNNKRPGRGYCNCASSRGNAQQAYHERCRCERIEESLRVCLRLLTALVRGWLARLLQTQF